MLHFCKYLYIVFSGDIRFNDPSFFQIFIFLAGKAFYLTYRTILPYLAGMPLLHVVSQSKFGVLFGMRYSLRFFPRYINTFWLMVFLAIFSPLSFKCRTSVETSIGLNRTKMVNSHAGTFLSTSSARATSRLSLLYLGGSCKLKRLRTMPPIRGFGHTQLVRIKTI